MHLFLRLLYAIWLEPEHRFIRLDVTQELVDEFQNRHGLSISICLHLYYILFCLIVYRYLVDCLFDSYLYQTYRFSVQSTKLIRSSDQIRRFEAVQLTYPLAYLSGRPSVYMPFSSSNIMMGFR